MTSNAVASAETLRSSALALPGTIEVPHFHRTAFKVRRIFASLSATDDMANLRLTPEQQQFWCDLLPMAVAPVPNRWGERGWTEVRLSHIGSDDLVMLVRNAWELGGAR